MLQAPGYYYHRSDLTALLDEPDQDAAPNVPRTPPAQKQIATAYGVKVLKCWCSYRNTTKVTGTRKFPIRITVG
jgi:hypothetical protein